MKIRIPTQKSKWWKYLALLIVIIVLLLLISLIGGAFYGYYKVTWYLIQTKSPTVQNIKLINEPIKITKVQMPLDLNQTLQKLYYDYSKYIEFVYCLDGVLKNDTFIITNWYQPKITSASQINVVHEPCSSIANIHSHPANGRKDIDNLCSFSRKDYYSAGSQGFILIGLVCPKGYVFQHKKDFNKNLEVIIK